MPATPALWSPARRSPSLRLPVRSDEGLAVLTAVSLMVQWHVCCRLLIQLMTGCGLRPGVERRPLIPSPTQSYQARRPFCLELRCTEMSVDLGLH